MKIAVFIKSTTFHKSHGGLETQNKALCEGLVKKGHKVTVFSPKKEYESDSAEQNGVSYTFIESDYKKYIFARFNRNSWYKKSLECFKEAHEKENFDVVLGQSASAESIIENKLKLGVKTVSIAHGTTSSEFITFFKNISNLKDFYWLVRNTQYFFRQYFGRQRKFVLHSDMVVAVSDYVRKALISETFILEDRIKVIHNGVDGDLYRFDRGDTKSGGITNIYFIGRLEKSKGLLTILDIVSKIDRDVIIHIVGDGPCSTEAQKKVGELGIQEKVIFHGRLPHNEFIKKVNPDIFVFPTKRIEGFPMVLVESMFAGIPVVAFDCGGVSDAVEDGKTGYLIKAGDVVDFQDKLTRLIDNESERISFGNNSKDKAEKEFTIGKMLDEYEKVLCEVIK